MHKKLRWILLTVLVYFIVMSGDRVFLLFTSGHLKGISKNVPATFWMGVRYDLRELGILAVIMLLLSAIPFFNPFKTNSGKKFWIGFLSIVSVLVVFIYVIDALHFDYLAHRL